MSVSWPTEIVANTVAQEFGGLCRRVRGPDHQLQGDATTPDVADVDHPLVNLKSQEKESRTDLLK